MVISEANEMVNKAMKVILSCKSVDQLNNAIEFARLVHRQLSKEIGFVNSTKFHTLIERSIGFAQCQIKIGSK
jgi:hypothetical protein